MINFAEHVTACTLLSEAYYANRIDIAIRTAEARWPGEGRIVGFRPGRVSSGGYAFRIDGEQTVRVFVTGVSNRAMSQNMALGYANPIDEGQAGRWNRHARLDAGDLWDNQLREMLRPHDRVHLYGHSAGGAVVEAAAVLVRRALPDTDVRIITYGAPCPSEGGACLPMALSDRQRFMSWNDPVPLIPFASVAMGDLIILYAANATPARGQLNGPAPWQFRQPPGGLRIRGGTISANELPYVLDRQLERVNDWVNQVPASGIAHDINIYRSEFSQLLREYPVGWERAPRSTIPARQGMEPIQVVMPFDLPWQRGVDLVMPMVIRPNGIASDVAGSTLGQASITREKTMFLKLGPRLKFKKVKVGQTWQVMLGDAIVLVADQKKVPGAFVRHANRMVRSIGDTNTIWADAFLAAMMNLFQVAAVDATQSRPLMRVDF